MRFEPSEISGYFGRSRLWAAPVDLGSRNGFPSALPLVVCSIIEPVSSLPLLLPRLFQPSFLPLSLSFILLSLLSHSFF